MAATKAARTEVIRAQAGRRHYVPSRRVPHWGLRIDLVDPVVAFGVVGIPATEGSFQALVNRQTGKGFVTPSDPGLEPWRSAVRQAARQVTGVANWTAITEPVVVAATFSMPNTEAATKRGDTFLTNTPDVDKLMRALGDSLVPRHIPNSEFKGLPGAVAKRLRAQAMQEARRHTVLHDDNLIVGWTHSVKMYAGSTQYTPRDPGVLVEVWRADDLFDPMSRGAIAHATAADILGLATPEAGWPAVLGEAAAGHRPPRRPILLTSQLAHQDALVVAGILMSEGPSADIPLLAKAA